MRVCELDAGLGKRLVFYWRSFALFAADLCTQLRPLASSDRTPRTPQDLFGSKNNCSVSLIGAYCSNVELNKEKYSFFAVTAFNTGTIN
jgi:hypothetical protein